MTTRRRDWQEGDRSTAICPACRARREMRFAYRGVPLKRSQMTPQGVLVGVCTTRGSIASIPQQSAGRLKDARLLV